MSEVTYPILPGQTWPRIKSPQFKTLVRRANGRRFALSLQAQPTYVIRIAYSYLRQADFETLCAFFKARSGSADDFLFNDRDDNTATDQVFGIGDGVTLDFQLVRSLAGFVEPVYALAASPTIKKAGVTVTPTISTQGKVSFATAPGAGQALTWTGSYLWRVAFTKDAQEFEEFARSLWVTKTVELETFHP